MAKGKRAEAGRRARRVPRRGRGPVGLAVCVLAQAGLLLAACGVGGCGSGRDPKAPLTVDEGDALLREIRDDPSKMKDLTPAQRQYLIKTLKK